MGSAALAAVGRGPEDGGIVSHRHVKRQSRGQRTHGPVWREGQWPVSLPQTQREAREVLGRGGQHMLEGSLCEMLGCSFSSVG